MKSLPSYKQKAYDWYDLGVNLLEEKRASESIAHFSKAIYLLPESDFRFYAERAEAYFQLSDFKSSISNYRKACSFDEADGTTRDAFVRVLDVQAMFAYRENVDDLSLAEALLSEAVEMDGLFWRGFLHRALVRVSSEQWQQALDDLNRCMFLKRASLQTHTFFELKCTGS